MTEPPNDLRIAIDSKGMAWLFLVLGVLGCAAAGVLATGVGNGPWFAPLIPGPLGLIFIGVTFLLRDHAEFHFDHHAGQLTWFRQSWFGVMRKEGREALQDVKGARVIGSAGSGPGESPTWRCVIDLDPGFIPLTRSEDNNERVHNERAEQINAWLQSHRG